MADAVILIPGFFGFGRFGTKPGTTLEYFDGVRREFEHAEPALKGRVVVHEPPPTGSVDERVASLHEAVRSVLEGRALPHNQQVRANRIHLVGHSAGGVDARLYANSSFTWTGGPRDEERKNTLSALGHVVTLSAPLSGTPIARSAAFDFDVVSFGVYLMSILGMRKIRLPATVLLAMSGLAGKVPESNLFNALLRFSAGLDDHTACEVQDFFSALATDRQLIRGLRVSAMTSRTAGLRETDHPNLHCYASVSPPPRWARGDAFARLVYRIAYDAMAAGPTPGVLPQGPVLGGRVIERLRDADPGDGVVPVVSQTLDGVAAAIVEGDHLDVIGHYDGGSGITVFKSNAGFDDGRMRTLWTHIAATLVKKTRSKPLAVAG